MLHTPTVKPLDAETLLASIGRTRLAVTAEEAQIAGGLGGAVAELLGEMLPTRLLRLGVRDRYGESGAPREMLEAFGLTGRQLAAAIARFVREGPALS